MAERIFIRKLNDHHWQWRVLGSDGYWTDVAGAGDLEHMISTLEGIAMPACLILPGTQSVVERMRVDAKEKNHIAKLLPYEMEEMVCEPIDDLHFSYSNYVDGHVLATYIKIDAIEKALEELAPLGCDVQQIFADFLFVSSQPESLTLLIDNGLMIARFGDGKGLTIEDDLCEVILSKLAEEVTAPNYITLVAPEDEQLNRLRAALPPNWLGEEIKAQSVERELEADLADELDAVMDEPVLESDAPVREELGDFWQWMDLGVLTSPLNFRRGMFARKLPVQRWWHLWKFPVYVAAAAFLFSFSLALGEYFAAKGEGKELRKQIEQVYLQAVPNGRRGDEERRLESLLKKSGGGEKATQPSNLAVILSGLSKSMEQQTDVKLTNFRYNGEQRELQVNLMVKGLEDLTRFKDLMAQNGLDTGSPRTSLQGDAYQASMKVTEKL